MEGGDSQAIGQGGVGASFERQARYGRAVGAVEGMNSSGSRQFLAVGFLGGEPWLLPLDRIDQSLKVAQVGLVLVLVGQQIDRNLKLSREVVHDMTHRT